MKQESEPQDRALTEEGSSKGNRKFLPGDKNKLASSGTKRRQV